MVSYNTVCGGGEYYADEYRCILNSSENKTSPYEAKWWNRIGVAPEDPWISTSPIDHFDAEYKILYGEDSYSDWQEDGLKIHNGSNVWIRYKSDEGRFCFGNCYDESQCVGASIVSTTEEKIECYGYRSCLNASTISTNAGEWYECSICCWGSYSCFNANIIERSATSSTTYGEIWCGALLSCAFVRNLHNPQGVVSCAGEQSCRGSTITLEDTTATLERHMECWADRSCMDANVTTRDKTTLRGHLSGLNGVFYSDDDTVKYEFSGSHSGYNATIVCGVGHNCNVICYGNGCNKLTLVCSDGNNSSCTFDVDCTYAEKSENSNVCPNGMLLFFAVIKYLVLSNSITIFHDIIQ